jgi:hypothetical protein
VSSINRFNCTLFDCILADNGTLGVQLAALRKAIEEVTSRAYQIGGKLSAAESASQNSATDLLQAREAIDRAG